MITRDVNCGARNKTCIEINEANFLHVITCEVPAVAELNENQVHSGRVVGISMSSKRVVGE